MKISLRVNLYEFCKLKNEARKLGAEMDILKQIPPSYANGHIAELAFFGCMGYLQSWLQEKRVYFRLRTSKELEFEDIDCMINRLPVQIKSQYGSYPQINYSEIHSLWLSYDNNAMTLENIKEIITMLKLGIEIPQEVYTRIIFLYNSYMIYYNIV